MKNLTQDELENMSYDDLAYLILEDTKKKMKITDLFSKITEILKLSAKEYEEHVADFFELISTDKRFILLEKGFCDLRINHSHKIVIEDDEDDYIDESFEPDEEATTGTVEDDSYDSDVDSEDDIVEDDLKDLVVVTEDDENEEML